MTFEVQTYDATDNTVYYETVEDAIVDAITDAVMLTVSEVFDFSHQSQGDSYQ